VIQLTENTASINNSPAKAVLRLTTIVSSQESCLP